MNLAKLQTQSRFQFLLTGFVAVLAVCLCSVANAAGPLASWKEGPIKKAILEFVAAVTDENGKEYVAPAKRIATFDNDGTLWVEYPMYTQALFALMRSASMPTTAKVTSAPSTRPLIRRMPMAGSSWI